MPSGNDAPTAPWKRLILPALGLALAIAVAVQVRARASAPATSAPAATPGASAAPVRVAAEGRVVAYPGAEVAVGTDLPGTIVRLNVEELDRVRKGQVLAEIRAEDLRAEIDESAGAIAEAEADRRLAEAENARQERLLAEGVGTRQAADASRRDLETAEARLAARRAGARRLSAQLAKARIASPIDGVVIARAANVGESVQPGDPIATIADLSRVRLEVELDEFDAGRVALGAPVEITAEGYDGRSWRGRVEEIPGAVVARRLEPQDPGRPTDTRVLRVKIAFEEPTPLKLGQRVETTIAVR